MSTEKAKEAKEAKSAEEAKEPPAALLPPPETRVIGLFREIDEAKAEELVYAFKLYASESNEPIDFFISTPGGTASDMFTVYDFMREVQNDIEVVTYGLGKVMSAGVPLLAAGTKGKRKIGKYCRIMIHSVIGGTGGALHDLENEMREIQHIQDMYIRALCEETKFTKKKLKDLFSQNVNVYLSAEEAVEYGIADIII
jgi:ATP-dependent Clp protease, protease subunit